MSKDKGKKETKKAPATEGKKSTSDYQSGKKSVSQLDLGSNKGKK
ncbi:hypothetical protein BDD43_5088 [Mucilaginibacter gracilis]|uniref:Uncharacterized protein n=1 Tax=Mucilaginibacter gracilis TaxID=423350 RepID=A0A495J766_9SPHI|nr:hypothetical protein [Mucilaginibacter gracilis]RKR84835.1 hypothetical protein BDD43_5088 [Mucilaginibacter gracilis]